MLGRLEPRWAPQMWVPVFVFVLFTLGVLRPSFLDVTFAHTGDAWAIAFSLLFVVFQLAFVFSLPLAILARSIIGEPWDGVWWVVGPLVVLAVLGLLLSLLLTDSGAAKARLFGKGICLIAGFAYLAASLRRRNPRTAHKAWLPLTVISCVSIWSLFSFAALQFSARQIADGTPYRILLGERHEYGYEPPSSWLDLRGLDLGEDTLNGGGSDDFNFTYYALLSVDGRSECWNWSKRRLRFEEVVRRNDNFPQGCGDR